MLLMAESVLPVISLTVTNIIAVVKFRNVMKKKREIAITLTFICVIARTFDATFAIFSRVRLFLEIVVSDELEALFGLFRGISFAVMFTEHALDGVLYYIFDKNMRTIFKRDTNVNEK